MCHPFWRAAWQGQLKPQISVWGAEGQWGLLQDEDGPWPEKLGRCGFRAGLWRAEPVTHCLRYSGDMGGSARVDTSLSGGCFQGLGSPSRVDGTLRLLAAQLGGDVGSF